MDALSEIVQDGAIRLVDISDYKIYVRTRDKGSPSIVDLPFPTTNLSSHSHFGPDDMRTQPLFSLTEEDLLVRRSGQVLGRDTADVKDLLADEVSDPATSPMFQQDRAAFDKVLGPTIALSLRRHITWFGADDPDEQVRQVLSTIAPSAATLLVLPLWHSRGKPGHMLLIAFEARPRDPEEVETIAKKIMNATMDALTMARARSMEDARTMFNLVQSQ